MFKFTRIITARTSDGNDAMDDYEVVQYTCIREACENLGDVEVLDIINRAIKTRARVMARAKLIWELQHKK